MDTYTPDIADELEDLPLVVPALAPAKPVEAKPAKVDPKVKKAANDAAANAKKKEEARKRKEEDAALADAEKEIKKALLGEGKCNVAVGVQLKKIKTNYKGRFTKWHKENLGMSNGSVANYMHAADAAAELHKLVTKDKHDAIYQLPPTVLYGFHKLDDDGKQEIATKIEAGEIVKALPRKPKDKPEPASAEGSSEDDAGAAAPVPANDPDTKAAEELAKEIVAKLDASTRRKLQNHPGFGSVMLHAILKDAISIRGIV